jgi:SAM-dependent methyltransferase
MRRKQISFYKKECRLCESKKLKRVLELNPTPIGDDYKKKKTKNEAHYDLNLNLCLNCKFVQLSNVLDSKTVYGDYLYVTNTSVGLPEHFEKFIDFLIKKKFLTVNSKVLEVGCNDGTLLRKINSKRRLVLGIDPAKKLIRNLKNKFEIIGQDYNYLLSKKIKNKYGDFNLIIANNVIANIDNLNDIFLSLKNNLAEDGFFVMETFSLYGILKNNLFDNIYHEHISYFTVNNFKRFAKRYNLSLVSAIPLKVKGGSIRFIFKKTRKKILLDKITKNYVLKEKYLLKNLFKYFQKLQLKNRKNIQTIHNFIRNNCKSHKISAYGASVGSTTFLYYYKLNKYIDFIYDDEKLRHDLYSPGSNLKVLSPRMIEKNTPKYIIILAWRYSENIIKKNRKYLKRGGCFIVPLPNFKLVKYE